MIIMLLMLVVLVVFVIAVFIVVYWQLSSPHVIMVLPAVAVVTVGVIGRACPPLSSVRTHLTLLYDHSVCAEA